MVPAPFNERRRYLDNERCSAVFNHRGGRRILGVAEREVLCDAAGMNVEAHVWKVHLP